jgi:DNA mismatch endonuclease, patch repair protein
MTDVLTPQQRHLNMSRIRGKDTAPEMLLRRGLHARGLRFRLHRRDLPGCPDLVFPLYRAVIFINGCFWHGHNCSMFKLPATRSEFWAAKIAGTQMRDALALKSLSKEGWRSLVIWECLLRGPRRLTVEDVVSRVIEWLQREQFARAFPTRKDRIHFELTEVESQATTVDSLDAWNRGTSDNPVE